MNQGFVAFLDVLGFSNLISSDVSGEHTEAYLTAVKETTVGKAIEYAVFSDSVILTIVRQDPDGLLAIASACSRLMARLLAQGVAIRGAITYGSYIRSVIGESVFVAGRPIIEAHHFEQQQDWVGVMVAPSALQRVPDLKERCAFPPESGDALEVIGSRLPWCLAIQPCHSIPFHSVTPFENETFDGFAIVPVSDVQTAVEIREAIQSAMNRLDWLRMIAPSSSAQRKHKNAGQWLYSIYRFWEIASRSAGALPG